MVSGAFGFGELPAESSGFKEYDECLDPPFLTPPPQKKKKKGRPRQPFLQGPDGTSPKRNLKPSLNLES